MFEISNCGSCCDELFREFKFEDIKEANPLECGGVYTIRIKEQGTDKEIIVKKVNELFQKLGWETVTYHLKRNIERLKSIENCPIIYIGQTNDMWRRYDQGFWGIKNHQAKFPAWALMYFGWELQFGWKPSDNPQKEEEDLKDKYKEAHNNKLPALMKE